MGEVYRARDERLKREVAIKVLPASYSQDSDRLRRFEHEAQAAGALNHPNITAVYDVGTAEDGSPYVVQELLEGETLRAELAGGRFTPRRAIEYAIQMAHGLAAAHEKGIVHRDLKPENLLITKDGRVKILDFGLAKLTQPEGGGTSDTNLPTETRGTEPGVVMGTLGYMSPEQIKGRSADARSDIFAFGTILYEMLSGKKAFQAESAGETMAAILREDPVDLFVTNHSVSPGLERIVRHCLEKSPERRFHSAYDLAFDLEALSGVSGSAATRAAGASPTRAHALRAAALGAVAVGLLFAGFWAGHLGPSSARTIPAADQITRRRLTYRRGNILFARFTADPQNVIYGAAWGDHPTEIFMSHVGSPETRALGLPGTSLLSVSPSGELAILLKKNDLYGPTGSGTLARVPLAGGAPRSIAEDVVSADWTPDGNSLAVLRNLGGKFALEFPPGKTLYSVGAELSSVRVSPDGKRIALIEFDGAQYRIDVIDTGGNRKVLAKDFIEIGSLAWGPSGREIWFDGVDRRPAPGIFAVSLEGAERTVATTTDIERLQDVARDGSILLERVISTRSIRGSFNGDREEHDLSWLDHSALGSLSEDGKTLLFWESGEGGGSNGSAYLRATDGSPAVRLGDGAAFDLSPDGKWALTFLPSSPAPRLVLLPTGVGEPKSLPVEGLQILWAVFLPPDGKRISIVASEAGHGVRTYVMDLSGGKPIPFTPEVRYAGALSPDGQYAADSGLDGRAIVFPVAGGKPRPIAGLDPGDVPIQWSADGEYVYATRYKEVPLPVYRVDMKTGKKELWKELMPPEKTGLVGIDEVAVTRDGRSYAYSFIRVAASDLFLVKGWR